MPLLTTVAPLRLPFSPGLCFSLSLPSLLRPPSPFPSRIPSRHLLVQSNLSLTQPTPQIASKANSISSSISISSSNIRSRVSWAKPVLIQGSVLCGEASGGHRRVRRTMAASTAEGGLVATHTADNCIFCKIRDGVIPSTKVLETENAFAILDAFPMTRGHTLLIPKKHYAFMEEMPPEEAAALFQELPRLSRAVRVASGVDGVNIAQNNGSIAGQVVFHVHIHILPRTENDGLFKLGKSGGMVAPEEAAAMKDAITSALTASASL